MTDIQERNCNDCYKPRCDKECYDIVKAKEEEMKIYEANPKKYYSA
jgi:hypothetical protein